MRIKYLLKFILPNRYKLLVLLLLSSILFIQSEERYLEKSNSKGRLVLVHEHHYGKPFVYYFKQDKKNAIISYDAISYNILIAYSFTLILHALVLLAFTVIKAPSLKHKSAALLVFVAILSLPYMLLYMFGQTLINDAVIARSYWKVKGLIYLKISPNRLSFDDLDFPLKEAALNKDLRMTQTLIKRGADINMANKLGETALHIAVRENAFNIIKALIKAGANVNVGDTVGNTPLHYVDHPKIAKLLLSHKANPNKPNNKKQTPLFLVNNWRSKSIILKKGGKVNLQDRHGDTALHYVLNPEEVRVLVSAGAKVNLKNNSGQTVLHYIIPKDKVTTFPWAPEVASALIRRGANVDVKDKLGLSPLHYAIKNCNPRSKFGSTLETGRVFFKVSSRAKLQFRSKKYSGTLAVVIKADKDKCWQRISKK